MIHNLELAIASLEKQYEEMWAETRGVRRSTASADLAILGAQIDRYKAELANYLMVADTESTQTLIKRGRNDEN